MSQYKIELFTNPVFDDQYRYRVYEVVNGESAKDNKETLIVSGNNTFETLLTEIHYWFAHSDK